MPTPQEVIELVERFHRNSENYKGLHYKETQLRREFLDPFFESFGWDVANKQGYAESYKEVIHEDSLTTRGETTAPDYCFRIGGVRKFFVEAKKPSVNIENAPDPAFQLRRYGWSAKLPLSILTDFEEFAVYDCRVKPVRSDDSSVARVLYMKYEDYLDRWDEIAGIFSKDAILKGAFDKYADTNKQKKGTLPVDVAFLQEIESWRELLAKNIALRNEHLKVEELNFCVQRTIDRIIFLRICEDRGIEDYGRLQSLLNGDEIYGRLREFYRQADDRYNSGLFHFTQEKDRSESPDELTPSLSIDDKVLKEIVKSLYYPDSPYVFEAFPADILGHVYEQFLGKVIRLTSSHRAVVEDKPEVKKAGGVYYTPTYIVEYIVESTVGECLKRKNPKTAAQIKIVDPACGSGSFLLAAYECLLRWHLEWYESHEPEKWKSGRKPRIYQREHGEHRLTTDEKKRILLSCIFGVDIDPQAVEVTKLSLLLKVLEDESEQTLRRQMDWFQERALPDLGSNIQCGNSLIGHDFEGLQGDFLEDGRLREINPFDWEKGFPSVFARSEPGFDVVIGNPPYVRQEMLGDFKHYFESKYSLYHGVADLYIYFIEKGFSLLREGGRFSYIVANKWMRANYGEKLRAWLKEKHIEEIVDFGDLPVFRTATTYPCILRLRNDKPLETFLAAKVDSLDFEDLKKHIARSRYEVEQSRLEGEVSWSLADPRTMRLLEKLKSKGKPLGEYVEGKIYRGVLTGLNKAFVIDGETRERLIAEDAKSAEIIKPFLVGRDVKRYRPLPSHSYLILMPKGWTNANLQGTNSGWNWLKKSYPAIARHLEPFAREAEKRCDKGDYWWELRACDYYAEFEKPKIIFPDISLGGNFTLDEAGKHCCANTAYFIPNDDRYLLGILNSSLANFFYQNFFQPYRGGYLRFYYQDLSQTPIYNPKEKQNYDRMIHLVAHILDLQKALSKSRLPHEQSTLKGQIDALDEQIDRLVYELYELTDEEIEIVENSAKY